MPIHWTAPGHVPGEAGVANLLLPQPRWGILAIPYTTTNSSTIFATFTTCSTFTTCTISIVTTTTYTASIFTTTFTVQQSKARSLKVCNDIGYK